MAFNDQEISDEDGKPIALYTLKWGNTIWRYTSADRDITRTENAVEVTYLAKAVGDNGMVQGGSQENDFTLSIPADLPIVQLYRSTPPSDSIYLTVRRKHADSDDAPIYWIGTVGNVRRVNIAQAEIVGRTLLASFKRTGLRLAWTRGCPHILYDKLCRANKEDFMVTALVIALTGNTIDVELTEHAEGRWYDGGMIEWEANDDATVDRRGIEREITTANNIADERQRFVIFGSTDRIEVGMEIKLYAGCDRSPGMCEGKFNNLANYGGFQYMSGKSPFDGNPVF